jgi:hypothetical protein
MRLNAFVIGGLVWFVLAVLAGATGRTAQMQPPVPQVVLLGITVALVIGYRRVRAFRMWLDSLGLRSILALHLFRFIGIYFLVLYGRGELPYAFAVPGGWGDIISATGALVVMTMTSDVSSRRPLVLAWNTLGLLDILMVVVTATRLFIEDPSSMRALLRLPLSLLPTFLVPLIIASHLLLYRRLAVTARTAAPATSL